jgi:cytochrome b6-f complex iron-sulfur subunit
VLIRNERFNFPICVYKLDENNYTALLMECTHRSCELQPQGTYLICPCHGSEFNNKGVVQNPPAEQNLRTFKITTDNEHIYIQL